MSLHKFSHLPPPPVRDPIIQLDRVSRAFRSAQGEVTAISGLSLDIGRGDIFGIIGLSGAGKSTLLRLINLLERPDSGRVLVAGEELSALPKSALRHARKAIGMIFQQFNLLQNATVANNVAFPLKLHGASRADIARRVAECLAVVGLADKAEAYPAQLSGGQKQRVAIARALATRPEILLCDEPTSAIDPETTRSVLDVLRQINQDFGVTVVIVTHELSVVRAICRHVAVIEDGRIAEQFAIGTAAAQLRTAIAREVAHA